MRFLMIGAHLDDNEFRSAGITSKLVNWGHDVRFLSCCNGCGGHHIMTPGETVKRRAAESAAVAKVLGIQYDVWDIDDCSLVADLETRRRMIRYIRNYAPDVVISHRQNDYHADHRAVGLLVQDASYLLTVPHECPDAPAMRKMPVIMYYEDNFKNPTFRPDIVIDIGSEIDKKFRAVHCNESQIYEWLAYEDNLTPPTEESARMAWLKGGVTQDTTDEEVFAAKWSWGVRFAKTAAVFRERLIEIYGEELGRAVRFAEAFEVCEYGAPFAGAVKEVMEAIR